MQFAPVYPIVYPFLKHSFSNCLWSGSPGQKAIALTFDDGPHPLYTPKLLEVLARYEVKASFFCLGLCVERYPHLAFEITQQGHWIGLHGYEHKSFPLLTPNQLEVSLAKTQKAIANATNLEINQIRDVRPPNGLFTPKVLKQLQLHNYRVVMWSVVPEDWVRPGVSLVTQRVMSQVHNGSLIVLHDGHFGGEDVAVTVADLIPQLQKQGYNFFTVEQMWATLKKNQHLN